MLTPRSEFQGGLQTILIIQSTTINMGRIKAREEKYQAVETAIARAIKAHKGGLSIRAAAESEGVARSTLHERLKGAQSKRKAHDLEQIYYFVVGFLTNEFF